MNINICKKELCTGCMACYNICPVDAVTLYEDEFGFVYSKINGEKCVSCNKCRNICPQNSDNHLMSMTNGKCYAAWNLDDSARRNSSSGGIFYAMAKQVISENGVVFGAAFDINFNVYHTKAQTYEELKILQGSKYIQSNVGYTFRECKDYLITGKTVLFTGTPCQINGLLNFLGNKYNNLITIDILCHGVPSYKVLKSYYDSVEQRYRSKINKIAFRNKAVYGGWEHSCSMKIKLENGIIISSLKEDLYFWKSFLSNVCLRENCYQCNYAGKERCADITIGDFWGIERINEKEKHAGVSFLTVNTLKGMKYVNKINIYKEAREIIEAIPTNQTLVRPFEYNKKRADFFRKIETYGFRRAVYWLFPKNMLIWNIKILIRQMLGNTLYDKLKTFWHR